MMLIGVTLMVWPVNRHGSSLRPDGWRRLGQQPWTL